MPNQWVTEKAHLCAKIINLRSKEMKHIKTVLTAITILIFVVTGTAFAQDNGATYTVGILNLYPELGNAVVGFKDGMDELGYVEGENITYVYDETLPFGELDQDEIIEAAQALVDADVDLLFASSGDEAAILMELTSDIPIVFSLSSDPVGVGLVESLTEPGGNATGIETGGFHERRLQLMVEIDPTIAKVYYPYYPEGTGAEDMLQGLLETAEDLDIELVIAEFTDVDSVQAAIEDIPDDIDAIFFSPEGLLFQFFPDWVGVSMQLQAGISIPAYMPMPGVLMGYGPDPSTGGQQASKIVDRILMGADPSDMPVQSAEYFLMVNLETAMVIDLDISRGILRQANMIVRPGEQ
jgi:putative tryptophan/tyrosine transport system substrate-binding protein